MARLNSSNRVSNRQQSQIYCRDNYSVARKKFAHTLEHYQSCPAHMACLCVDRTPPPRRGDVVGVAEIRLRGHHHTSIDILCTTLLYPQK